MNRFITDSRYIKTHLLVVPYLSDTEISNFFDVSQYIVMQAFSRMSLCLRVMIVNELLRKSIDMKKRHIVKKIVVYLQTYGGLYKNFYDLDNTWFRNSHMYNKLMECNTVFDNISSDEYKDLINKFGCNEHVLNLEINTSHDEITDFNKLVKYYFNNVCFEEKHGMVSMMIYHACCVNDIEFIMNVNTYIMTSTYVDNSCVFDTILECLASQPIKFKNILIKYKDHILRKNKSLIYEQKTTLIAYCVNMNYVDTVKLLVENKCDINIEGYKITPLMFYCSYTGNYELFSYLIDSGVDTFVDDEMGDFIINDIIKTDAKRQTTRGLEIIIEKVDTFDANQGDIDGLFPLLQACKVDSYDHALLLIKAGANVNMDSYGRRYTYAIFEAINRNNLRLVQLLVNNGAFLDVRHFECDSTPLQYANKLGHNEISEYLLSRGAL